jgi:hypothetical protein
VGDASHGWQDKSPAVRLGHVVGWIECFVSLTADACWRTGHKAQRIQCYERHRLYFCGRRALRSKGASREERMPSWDVPNWGRFQIANSRCVLNVLAHCGLPTPVEFDRSLGISTLHHAVALPDTAAA